MKFLSTKNRNLFCVLTIFFMYLSVSHCWYNKDFAPKGVYKAMRTHYIGRFAIAVPSAMEEKIRSSRLRYVEINEITWCKDVTTEQSRTAEWERFMADIKQIVPPEGKDRVIIKSNNYDSIGKWTKGIFYYYNRFSNDAAKWALLVDAGRTGAWFIGDPTDVEHELAHPKMAPNIQNLAKSYQPQDLKSPQTPPPDNCFYLQHGIINLPYSEEEESIARFEGSPLHLTLLIEMEMDFTQERETMGLITATRGFLAAALIAPGGGASKIRLRKREVAGMPGEEAVIRVREGDTKDLVFTWQYNGKDNSGEYPATKIEMESPDGHLSEKLAIWDAVLDSMKPMFERKSHEP